MGHGGDVERRGEVSSELKGVAQTLRRCRDRGWVYLVPDRAQSFKNFKAFCLFNIDRHAEMRIQVYELLK